jgi:hypothetical protein
MSRSMNTCKTCRFYDDGQCRKNPPVAVLEGKSIHGIFPRVEDGDWCGQFAEMTQLSVILTDRQLARLHGYGSPMARTIYRVRPLIKDYSVEECCRILGAKSGSRAYNNITIVYGWLTNTTG